jgi:hypothetical protein
MAPQKTLSFPNQTCSTCLIIYILSIFSLFMSSVRTGLSLVFRLSNGVLVMYVIGIENKGRANCPRTSWNAEFRQNPAKFCRIRRNSTVRKPAKQHRMSCQLTNQCSITYVSFPSHAHGVYTIAPISTCWTRPLLGESKALINNKWEVSFYSSDKMFLFSSLVF